MDAADWDARYSDPEPVFGTAPNQFLVPELDGVAPGRALDVACGQGRNAIWLAGKGWQVVGVDWSKVGVARAADLAERAGVSSRTRFVVGDAVQGPLPGAPYDAVVMAYLQLDAAERARALRNAAEVLAPGGVLVVIAHHSRNLAEGYAGPQDPRFLFTPEDVAADLAGVGDVQVERAEVVDRPVDTPEGPRTAIDLVVRARRLSPQRQG